jgi:hypothetical protein
MGKINKTLKALGMIIRRPWLLNHVLNDEGAKRRYVTRKYHFADGFPVIDITDIIPADSITIKPFAFLDGGSLPTDLALLKSLCVKYSVKDYLEIGTWRGESVANVAATGANCVTVNLPDEEMRRMGLAENYIQMHRFFSKDLPNVNHIQANSLTFDFASLGKKFDLIFIDGDHHSESITKDTITAFGLLKNDKSMIVWHDYGIGPETPRFEVIAGILDGCPAEVRKNLYHVSNTLCAVYTSEKFVARPMTANVKPSFSFSLKIEVEKI